MSAAEDKVLEALRASLKEVDRLRRQNWELVSSSREPIAIIGMSCRYPGGVRSPDDLWRLVEDGQDAVGALPTNRGWSIDDLQREGLPHAGGFLHDADRFDA